MEFTEDKYLHLSVLTKIEVGPTSMVKAASQDLGVQSTVHGKYPQCLVSKALMSKSMASKRLIPQVFWKHSCKTSLGTYPFSWGSLCKRRPLSSHQPTWACRCSCGGIQQKPSVKPRGAQQSLQVEVSVWRRWNEKEFQDDQMRHCRNKS